MIKNKIGADKILSVYWFFILFIISSGIFAMVYVFYNSPFDVRETESGILADKTAECILEQGRIDSEWISGSQIAETGDTCQTESECQKIIGMKIVSIVNGMKNNLGIQDIDNSVKQGGVAENFECLVLQIAMQESSLRHCVEFQKDGNPLYCDGKREEVKSLSNDRETSLGVLQVNTKVHNVDAENFKEGIVYGVEKVLIQQYKETKDGKLFEPTNKNYSGWMAAIRGYNGWGFGGDNDYVEKVISKREFIQSTFPEFCSQNVIVESEKKNLEEECSLNFKSEFDTEQFYLQVDFYNFESFDVKNPMKTIYDGNINLKADCEVQEEKTFERQAICAEKKVYALDENGNKFIIKILSAVRKTEKNAV